MLQYINKFKTDGLFLISAIFLGLLLLFAIFGPYFRHSYEDPIGRTYLPIGSKVSVGTNEQGKEIVSSTWLGTDEQGRDVVARLAYGARISLFIGLAVQCIAIVIGVAMGVLGVFAPKWISIPLMRFTDGMFAFPDILLAFLIIGAWDTGIIPVIVALSITSWPSMTRIVKNQIESLKDREFVVASRALGAGPTYIVLKHILPQLWGLILAISIIGVANTILAESTLSFIGIGVRPPDPSWGSMINNARADMNSHPLLLVWPCLLLSLTIFGMNFVGEGLRDMMDPKVRTKKE